MDLPGFRNLNRGDRDWFLNPGSTVLHLHTYELHKKTSYVMTTWEKRNGKIIVYICSAVLAMTIQISLPAHPITR